MRKELTAVLSLGALLLAGTRGERAAVTRETVTRKGLMMKNGVQVECSGDPYCDAQPFIECCPIGPDAWRFQQVPSPHVAGEEPQRSARNQGQKALRRHRRASERDYAREQLLRKPGLHPQQHQKMLDRA